MSPHVGENIWPAISKSKVSAAAAEGSQLGHKQAGHSVLTEGCKES